MCDLRRLAKISKLIGASLILAGGAAATSDDRVPEPFRGATAGSPFVVQYDDLDYIYKKSVMRTGASDRSRAPKARPPIGTRISRSNPKSTRLEGNRVNFDIFRGDNLALVSRIRRELEAIPGVLPMVQWRREEQLAFWLNLYNLTVIEQVALIYPETNLKKLHRARGSEPALLDRKLLTVAGIALSLNDIQHKILIPKFRNPLVMYGLFQGYVGSPNMRAEAYTGKRVFDQLEANAKEFINSNRGNQIDSSLMRVSALYDVNRVLFPEWQDSLKRHFAYYGDWVLKGRIEGVRRVKANITDWYIADLHGGHKGLATAANTNPAALVSRNALPEGYEPFRLINKMQTGTRFPVHVVEYLERLKQRNVKQRRGNVVLEPVKKKKDAPEEDGFIG